MVGFSKDINSSIQVSVKANNDREVPWLIKLQGIFMGLVVSVILLSVLYVGISGIAGLQVSYAAFDKEMGPTAQKKQQQ